MVKQKRGRGDRQRYQDESKIACEVGSGISGAFVWGIEEAGV
jgi:hypothetical protein